MDRKVLKYLSDVLSAIEEIELFMSTRPRQYQVFCDDLLFRRGIERNLEIIGEAMNRALKLRPELPITDARKIVDTRNLVITQTSLEVGHSRIDIHNHGHLSLRNP